MAAPCFIAWNGATTALTAPVAGVASASTVTPKTMLQLKTGAQKIRIVEWGYLFAATPTGPVTMELIETGQVGATVTSGSTAMVSNYSNVDGSVGSQIAAGGTAATGYTATAEGSITASRLLAQTYDYATYFKQQFPLGREPEVNGGGYFLRIRATPSVTAPTTISCYVVWEE